MLKVTLNSDSLEALKLDLLKAFPDVKSAYRVEAMARGLGFNTYAALKAACGEGGAECAVSEDEFSAFLRTRGVVVDPRLMLRATARGAIRSVMRREPRLTHFGLGVYSGARLAPDEYEREFREERDAILIDGAVEQFLAASEFISHLEPRQTLNRNRSSYGLKHDVERYFRDDTKSVFGQVYVANGSFIAAAIHAGFRHRPTHAGSPNAYFNISDPSVKRALERSN